MQVRFEDYARENRAFKDKIAENLQKALELRSEYDHQSYIAKFEEDFAKYNGSRYAIAVNSGTAALELSLLSAGVGEKDEVILPSYTYISSALAVSNVGALPVFADILKGPLTIDAEDVLRKITRKTKAIIPVHIHGAPCEMGQLMQIAEKKNLSVIEDCSHAHGAIYKNKKVGNFGIGSFSMHSSKNLSGIGNSGMITTNSRIIYNKIKKMIEVSNDPDYSLCRRTPCRADVLQTAVLMAKLPFLDKIADRKRHIAGVYAQALAQRSTVSLQVVPEYSRHVYRDFVILMKNPDTLKTYLRKSGIECKQRYQVPLHLTKYYSRMGLKQCKLPVTESVFNTALWLPVSFALAKTELEYISGKLKSF